MSEETIFNREEKADELFDRILKNPYACAALQNTFYEYIDRGDEIDNGVNPEEFSKALFNAYLHKDLTAFLMVICKNTVFDLLRNAGIIPFRLNADGKKNPEILTDDQGHLLKDVNVNHHEWRKFEKIYEIETQAQVYYAKAYRYHHEYENDNMQVEQEASEENDGIFLVYKRDNTKGKKTEAQAYSDLVDMMNILHAELPSAFVYLGQGTLQQDDKVYDELGIFIPHPVLGKALVNHVKKADEIVNG